MEKIFTDTHDQMRNLFLEVSRLMDEQIRIRIEEKKIPFDPDRFSRILREGQEFEHYYFDYGLPTQVRVISIQKDCTITQDETFTGVKFTATKKYF